MTTAWQWPTEEEEQSAPRVNGFTFYEALALAVGAVEPMGEGADPGPLADYIASDAPLTANDRQGLADLLWMLPTSFHRGARSKRKQNRAALDEATYQLARRVVEEQKLWCEQHPTRTGALRQRVPTANTKQIIMNLSDSLAVVDNVVRILKNRARL